MIDWGDYRDISKKLADVDICFDLRKLNFVYRNSLPIKIFEYMACGRPVIFSNARVIRKELQVNRFGFLVNPEKTDQILQCISKYINDPFLLQNHSFEARWFVETYYNWQNLEKKLLDFIED
jgi:glycosyltransferase involved in cell wall biosynthesis